MIRSGAVPCAISHATRAESVVVLPVPAPARMSSGPPSWMSAAGLMTTGAGGVTWRPPERGREEQRVLSVAVSRSHREGGTSVAYAGTEPSNLYRSEDGGRSWQLLPALRDLPGEPNWSFPPR